MNKPNKMLCVGGPCAGEYIEAGNAYNHGLTPEEKCMYIKHELLGRKFYLPEWMKTYEFWDLLTYGYEQHCKAVAERNKVDFGSQAEKWKAIMEFIETYSPKKKAELDKAEEDLKAIQDSYTASFLRSCKTVIIVNPFGEPSPLTLSYGKCQYGHLNDSMEFVVPMTVIENKLESISESNLGRIGTPICIVP